MKVLSIINIKGGVAKTITAVNLAYNLAAVHHKRVLLIDLDPQGHSSFFYGVRCNDRPCVADVFKQPTADAIHNAMRGCALKDIPEGTQLFLLPADFRLVTANREMLIDINRSPRVLDKALRTVAHEFDHVIIDHAPSLDMATINGLCASDTVMVPVTPDEFAADGLELLCHHVQELQDDWSARLQIMGCVFTQWRPSKTAQEAVRAMNATGLPMMQSVIRATCKVPETERVHKPLLLHAPRSTAAQDYLALTEEYLQKVSQLDTQNGGGV